LAGAKRQIAATTAAAAIIARFICVLEDGLASYTENTLNTFVTRMVARQEAFANVH
jgi:hypothetical protein